MRFPAVAGRFYPADADLLSATIDSCFRHPLGPGVSDSCDGQRHVRGIMVPHAGYACSGMIAAHGFKAIADDGVPDVYIVIGPDHHGLAHCRNVFSSEDYVTPLGVCRTDGDICEALSDYLPDDPDAHRFEHSIEVEIPFIQHIDPNPAIVPIMMGDQSYGSAAELTSILVDACEGRDVAVVASSDMSHYVPKSVAAFLDGAVLDRISEMDSKGLYDTVMDRRISMCGYGPVMVAMMFSKGAHAEGIVHADSFDALGMDPDSVVGYASAAFVSDKRRY